MKKLTRSNFRLHSSFYNYTTYIGAFIATVGFLVFLSVHVISYFYFVGHRYHSLFIWIVIPAFIILGLIIALIGVLIKRKKEKRLNFDHNKSYPVFNFNNPSTRTGVFMFATGSFVFLLLSSVGAYKAFHFTDSVEFCGTICHEVMKPEYVTYNNFAHARVSCVECHVGEGANWWAQSKLSGLVQVYAVVVDNFSRPISTPIKNLRPAQETCESCHWPGKFYSNKVVTNTHYLTDQYSTEWEMSLQMKTSSENCAGGLQEGIHWHINPDIKVEYISEGGNAKKIPWVRYTNLKTGEIMIFEDDSLKLTELQINSSEIREMDCIDCHNRPAHDYQTPIVFINQGITTGLIPHALPDIKLLSLDILSHDFTTTEGALAFIETRVNSYYEKQYEDIYANSPELIAKAIKGIQEEFKMNIFPEMNAKWDDYPNHIGHIEFDGCFRCHNGRHATHDNQVISMDCDQCHIIIAQGVPDTIQRASMCDGLEFVHLHDPDNAWKKGLCSECHNELWGNKKKRAIKDKNTGDKILFLDSLKVIREPEELPAK